jgi:hypothetical protein
MVIQCRLVSSLQRVITPLNLDDSDKKVLLKGTDRAGQWTYLPLLISISCCQTMGADTRPSNNYKSGYFALPI